ncbi:IS630 family transposase [Salicibibacter cibarius]|uniref:IS630 family transposase n=1 Tax=Salicibibacter cibarius TaxID=2743000 RepID=A0A7T6Z3S6_9BACI|nr:IS630 family transposase [Salicibibacter cibarius]QQK76251.1 IS630 family transposase [Salicibibacter cibarius]
MASLTKKEKRLLQEKKNGQSVEYRQKFRAHLVYETIYRKKPDRQVAEEQNTTEKTVKKWRKRFKEQGMKGIHDSPRSGAPRKFTIEQRCEVIAIACDKPKAYAFPIRPYWSLDSLAEAAAQHAQGPAMSRSSVQRTLQRNDLRPHRHDMWLHSKDPRFREKVNDIVSLYLEPPKDAVVICVDEKTGMQALERKFEPKSALPGQPGRYEHEYIRHGTMSLIAGFEITTGDVVAQCRPTRKADDLMAFMEKLAAAYPHQEVIIVWDNLNIHHDGPSERWSKFNERNGNRFSFYYTPKHASWMNQIEIFFSILHRRCLKWGSFHSQEALKANVMAFIQHWNYEEGHPFNWTFGGYPMQHEPKEAA